MQTKKGILISTLLVLMLVSCLLLGVSLTASAESEDSISDYDTNDLNKLKAFAQQGDNNNPETGLGWDLDKPWTWDYANWTVVDGKIRLKELNVYDRGLTLNGSLDLSNCTELTYLDFDNNGEGDLKLTSLNISCCTALEEVWCNGNQLASLNLTGCTSLYRLYCGDNMLTILNLYGFTNLEYLSCVSNQLTSLNLTGCTAISELYCWENMLTTLNLSGLINLEYLNCGSNQLTSLNLTGCTALSWLLCFDNMFTTLNLSSLTNLGVLSCEFNQLTSLDLTDCIDLAILQCSSNMFTTLNLSAHTNLRELDCSYNQLTLLNLNGCNALFRIKCNQNRLIGFDVTGLNLYYIDCSYNYIEDKNDVIGFSETWDTGNYHFSPQHQEGFFAASGIINLPTTAKVGTPLTLSGTVVPNDATNKTITEWRLNDYYDNEIGASIDGNVFKATSPGTAYLIAIVENGKAENEDFEFRFIITVTPATSDPPISSGSGGGGTTSFSVKFETDGGSAVSTAVIPNGGKLTKPTDPTKTGYAFAGWYTDKELAQAYDFEKTVTTGFTLYAKWTEVKAEIENKAPLPFSDVSKSNWFYDNVAYVYENGLMLGTADDKFSPNLTLTRGMVVTVLYRLAGEPDTAGLDNPFTDISNTWYTNAIKWAAENGIVTGYGDGKFGPDDKISREQMAAILYRYMEFAKINLSVTLQYITFADEAQISDYAKNAIQTLFKLGIIQGVGENTINPKGDATRAQFAAMIHRMQELAK